MPPVQPSFLVKQGLLVANETESSLFTVDKTPYLATFVRTGFFSVRLRSYPGLAILADNLNWPSGASPCIFGHVIPDDVNDVHVIASVDPGSFGNTIIHARSTVANFGALGTPDTIITAPVNRRYWNTETTRTPFGYVMVVEVSDGVGTYLAFYQNGSPIMDADWVPVGGRFSSGNTMGGPTIKFIDELGGYFITWLTNTDTTLFWTVCAFSYDLINFKVFDGNAGLANDVVVMVPSGAELKNASDLSFCEIKTDDVTELHVTYMDGNQGVDNFGAAIPAIENVRLAKYAGAFVDFVREYFPIALRLRQATVPRRPRQ